ncbi:EscE/YscE/SsaE family type III secretion system needle protein co-chaperone [Clostridium sp.]|uniref:EscE/YscE/SsaE family type III secretion system needle protein co-chaperone n=1 Tax=Clostridium sp. TaxID=1506 RepID=UPI003216462C
MQQNQGKNAKQHVQDVQSNLMDSTTCLNQALNSVEKPENRQKIQNTLNSVESALNSVNSTLSNYQE